MSELLNCYNKGCGQKYDTNENKVDSCQYHPGVPVFHDALKGWSCCKKRSTDFTEFLNIKGCTQGCHSNEKPKEPESEPSKPEESKREILISEVPKCRKPIQPPKPRPSSIEKMVRLKSSVGATLKQALEKQLGQMSLSEQNDVSEKEVKEGTSCKNNACQKCYENESSNLETCLYHPGVPIFHEGMKYWSCCQRKTSEFDNFLAQEGCTEGSHVWVKEQMDKVECRFDWHQTAQFVTVSVFSKLTIPDKTWVEANQVAVNINITYDGGKSVFRKHLSLKGVIDPEKSQVKMLGAKVEINLRKGEAGSWSGLEDCTKEEVQDESEDEIELE